MKIYQNINEIPHNINRAITVGSFDGVHLGHLQILKKLKNEAKRKKLKTMIITFEPHPQVYFNQLKNEVFPLLTTSEEKTSIFKILEIDEVFIINFDAQVANLEPAEFVFNYLQNIGLSALAIGYNHNFGKGRKGNLRLLEKINEKNKINNKNQFEIIQIPQFVKKNKKVSSTEIRRILMECTVENANELLGYNYFVTGMVCYGNGIGKKLGFPTANIKISRNKLLPINGVYICTVEIWGKQYHGVANIGYRPTITDTSTTIFPILEVHILDFLGDIYDVGITVTFLKFLRKEKKFNNMNELIQQIQNDINACKIFFDSGLH